MSDEPRGVTTAEQTADPSYPYDQPDSAAERAADPALPERPDGGATGPGNAAPDDTGGKPKRGFPSPLAVLLLVIVGVWLLALVIPSGEYQLDDAGSPIPSSFQEIESPMDFGERVEDLVLSPINGLYGIQDPETGHVGPFNRGALFGSAQVFLFILAIGGFMTVVFKTGALDFGIAHLAHRFRTQGAVLIVVLSVLFGILGSVMSWSDETLGFYALMIPLLLALGYDRIVVVAVVTVAPFVGSIGATVNPFRIGVGSDAAGVSIGDGIALRVLLLVLVMAATIMYTLRYAAQVKASPARSLVPTATISNRCQAPTRPCSGSSRSPSC